MHRKTGLLGIGLVASAIGGIAFAGARRARRSAAEAATALSAPIVIAHRGASGYRPEHTLEAYRFAIEQGADVIEPDLVPTRDDVLVARHENEISETTDVADHPEFADRRATRTIDGKTLTGWFTEDFTLAELKTLRAKERLPDLRRGNGAFDGQFEIPTLAEIIALVKQESVSRGRVIALYPETKHPAYFAAIHHPLETRLVTELHAAGWDTPDAPVFIQSFEVANLKVLAGMTKVRLIQLLERQGGPADGAVARYAAMTTPAGLREIATYAWGIGPDREMLRDGAGRGLVSAAHKAGLRVHPWTYRAENAFLPSGYRSGLDPRRRGDLARLLADDLALGIDGFFTDFPDIGIEARDRFRAGTE